MKDIEVMYEAPVIFTRDRDFVESLVSIKPGAIVLLPDDAVLYAPPYLTNKDTPQ